MTATRRHRVRNPRSVDSRTIPSAPGVWSLGQALPLAIIVLAGTLAYLNSFQGAFVFDDDKFIADNPRITPLFPITRHLLHTQRPLVGLSLAVNHAAGGLNVFGYHFFNLIVHLLAGLTLYGIVRRTMLILNGRDGAVGLVRWPACIAALLWVIHPLQTQSVTYVIQRAESMMGLFYLLTLYCTIRSSTGRGTSLWWIAAVLACFLGMGCKPVMATAPLMVLLSDRTFLSPSFREALGRRLPLYAGLAASWSVLLMTGAVEALLATPGGGRTITTGFGYRGVSPFDYALTQPRVILHYLQLAVWPANQCLDYGWPVTESTAVIIVTAAVIGAAVVASVYALWRRHWGGYVGAWFFLILAPTSSVVPIKDIAVEHRMYLPLAAVVVLVVAGAGWAVRQLRDALEWPDRRASALAVGLAAAASVALALTTVRRNAVYGDPVRLWQDVVDKRQRNPRARYNLGRVLENQDRYAEAVRPYQEAIDLNPEYPEAHNNLGNCYLDLGEHDRAVEQYRHVIALNPAWVAQAYCNLGNALAAREDYAAAIEAFEQCLEREPDHAVAHHKLGNAYYHLQQWTPAVQHQERAVALRPDWADAYSCLGHALLAKGDVADAVEPYRQAARFAPESLDEQLNLGTAMLRAGRPDEAVSQYKKALQLEPDNSAAHRNLGNALRTTGDIAAAATHFQRAVELAPDDAEAWNNLGAARQIQGRLHDAMLHYETALGLRSPYATAHYNLATALRDLGRHPEALEHFRLAHEQQAENVTFLYSLGSSLSAAGQSEEAREVLNDVLRRQPDHADALLTLAGLCYGEKQLDDALTHYDAYVRLQPQSAKGYYGRGLVYLAADRPAKAAEDLRNANRLDPADDQIRAALAAATMRAMEEVTDPQ